MDTKYYTPSIEEFHVGFEFEFNHKEIGWKKEILPFFNNYAAMWSSQRVDEDFRVKYLDREDIESLGWKLSGLAKNRFIKEFLKEGAPYDCSLQLSTSWILITINGMTAFCGTIKNKSELKKLMIQLGIK